MKSMNLSSTIMLLVLSTALNQTPSPAVYRIDPARSKIELVVFKSGLLKAIGHDHAIAAKSFSGEVRYSPTNLEDSSVNLNIESSFLVVLDDPHVSEKDREQVQANMEGEKVLDARKFPQIAFHSTGVTEIQKTGEDFTLKGTLNLHGQEKAIAFPVHIHPESNLLHVTGSAAIAQTDFGIKPIRGAAGGLRVKDEVYIRFDILAERSN